jgi:putative DNA primase/helicase
VTQEGPGILAWYVRGNQEWQRVGLKDPEVVKAYTQDYRAEMDVVGGWFAECCDSFLHDSQLRTEARELATDLYQSFVSYAKDNGIDAMPGPKFGSEMEQRGFKRKPSNGKHYRCGVRLKASPHNEGGRDRKDVD